MVLNAFSKSRSRKPFECVVLLREVHALAEGTAASKPPGHATPTCSGGKKSLASCFVTAQAHLPASRRSTSPTAIGLSPP
eukprot:1673255-Karenia_brevis.AAC.1